MIIKVLITLVALKFASLIVAIREALVTFAAHVGGLFGAFLRLALLNAAGVDFLGLYGVLVRWRNALELASGHLTHIVVARADTVIIGVADVDLNVLRLLIE